MKSRTLIIALVAAGLLSATGYFAYHLGMQAKNTTASSTTTDAQFDPATGKKILY